MIPHYIKNKLNSKVDLINVENFEKKFIKKKKKYILILFIIKENINNSS